MEAQDNITVENETDVVNNNSKEPENKTEAKLEILIAIFLGITALLTAWATWIGSLHGGNQSTNYTKSNNISTEGNSSFNEASQALMMDMLTWNNIMDYKLEVEMAESKGDEDTAELYNTKIDALKLSSCSEDFLAAIEWAENELENNDNYVTPFQMEGFIDSYYEDANAQIEEAQVLLEQGQQDNTNGDKFGLVTVIYSLVLFLLGVVGIFKRIPNRMVVFGIAVVFLAIATVYMLTIPLPTDFSFLGYFTS